MCDTQNIIDGVSFSVQGVVAGLMALKSGHALYQGISTVSSAKDMAEPLADILPEDWIVEEVVDVQGFGKMQFACLTAGLATTAHSTFLLVQSALRLQALQSIAEETKGIKQEVTDLKAEFDDLVDSCTKKLGKADQLIQKGANDPMAFMRISNLVVAIEPDILGFQVKLDRLMANVVSKIDAVELEKSGAVKGTVSAGINLASSAAYGTLSVVTPGGWAMAIAALTANVVGGSVAASTMVIEIVNIVKCNEILTELRQMESQLAEMKAAAEALKDRSRRVRVELAKLFGDDDVM